MLQTFLPLFLMTFGICLFIVLMQFLWKYVDEMVGKGLELHVLAEMFFYAALSFVPTALPLAILLASLMTFGNLGESFELLAMKSAGVSLLRIMRPLIIFISIVTLSAFYFQNYIIPVAQVKFYTLLFSIKQKSPELEIPSGIFYKGIPGNNVYVQEKTKNGLLKEVMIYNYSDGFDNAYIILSDSGRIKTSANKLFLVLSLYNGESFKNLNDQRRNTANEAVPYQRESFDYKEILIKFDANFSRTDESIMQEQYIGKDLNDLQTSIDSMTVRLDSMRELNASSVYQMSYKRTLPQPTEAGQEEAQQPVQAAGKKTKASVPVINFDSAYLALSPGMQLSMLNRSKSSLENTKSDYLFKSLQMGDEAQRIRRHETEMHKKFTLSFACLIFFFIGAPLGAIIRKGGLGMPVVISVFFFIFYYIIDNIGGKMARQGIWEAWEGMWLSSAVLTPLAIFLTYKAVNDSDILNSDIYMNAIRKFIGIRPSRKISRKEVIIYNPDYKSLASRLDKFTANCRAFLSNEKKRMGYITFWKQGGKDPKAEKLSEKLESITEELSNSDQILILNKLMDYPVLMGYELFAGKFNPKVGIALAIVFPLGIAVYLIGNYRRKLLWNDLQTVIKVNDELQDMIQNLNNK